MFVEKIKTEGLAQLSYVVGSGEQAAVIDPRRDYDVYIDIASQRGCRITHVFETHRNEDLLSGAARLADATGAKVYHGPDAAGEVAYAETAHEGDRFEIGEARLDVLETPGHTDDSLSFVLFDPASADDAVAVFSGDALFVGDVGRVDFYPERAREVAGLLYDSLEKILAVGDQAVLFPAHGAGSVCGSGMADRELSTLGHERRNNPRLQIGDRDAFIEAKLAEKHDLPPYFRRMESLNLAGAPAMRQVMTPPPLGVEEVAARIDECVLVDVRSASAYLGAHLPGSLALPVDLLSSFAGWLLDADDELLLVADDASQATQAAVQLARIGYDRIGGYLAPSLTAWAAGGGAFNSLPVVSHAEVKQRIEAGDDDWVLLDVRGAEEVERARIPGSTHVYVGEMPDVVGELDPRRRYTVMCGSGARATIAASLMLRREFERVDLFLGSLGAWTSHGHDVRD